MYNAKFTRAHTVQEIVDSFKGYVNSQSQGSGCPLIKDFQCRCSSCPVKSKDSCLGVRVICGGDFANNDALATHLESEGFTDSDMGRVLRELNND